MEGFMKVRNINGIFYPIIHDDFIDISLPLQICEVCSKTLCAKCLDLFNIVHECQYKYFIVSQKNYICNPCQTQREEEKRKDLKDKLQRAIKRARNKNV
jgi:hypothetical protein